MAGAHSPVVTFTSDFGTRDFYVAAMKAAALRHCPDARLIDVTHDVPRHDVLAASIVLERALDAFFEGTIHVAVVDPGVGTSRRILVVQINRQLVVCPDNGLITWAWRRQGPGEANELTWRPDRASHTFHGRDIMSPVAGMLASGHELTRLAHPLNDPILLDLHVAKGGDRVAAVIHVDAFGNATTNMPAEVVPPDADVCLRGKNIGPVRHTYGDVAPGQPLALIGSSGLLEIAVREGSAADTLGIKVGDKVTVER